MQRARFSKVSTWKNRGGPVLEKRILVALDDSIHSKKSINYVVKMRSVVKDLSYTLFHVQPTVSEYLIRDSHIDKKALSALKDVVSRNEMESRELLEGYKSSMIESGVNEEAIEIVSHPRTMGVAKDILNYARRNLHDAIVIGKRGTSRLEEIFLGSVANAVIEHANTTPVWAIDGDVSPGKILVAVDGSESALSAVDHISLMVGENPDVKLTLLHITPTLRDYCTIEFHEEGKIVEDVITHGDKKCIDNFHVHARQRFEEAGIAENRVIFREVKSTINIGKTIVDEAKKGNFSIVVIGRTGVNESFFMGSVSRYVINKASNCAVWLVP